MCVPRGKFVGVLEQSGGGVRAIAAPIRCKKWSCEFCGPRRRKQLFARVFHGPIAQPVKGFRPVYSHKLLTLTCPGAAYRAARTPKDALADMTRKWNLTTRALKKRLGEFHYLRIVENQQDGYPHFHILLAGGAIAPKSILADIRRLWTDHHGMGNVDIQKNRNGSIKKMVGYLMKYLTKTTVELPKGRRVYTASRGALSPAHKPECRNWLMHKLFWRDFQSIEERREYEAHTLFGLAQADPDINKMLIEEWRNTHYRGVGHVH